LSSRAELIAVEQRPINGKPDPAHISTSYVERQNLTMRMGMRRFTRLTNGFSKKVENLEHAVSLHLMHYNFARIHKTLRVARAMEAGLTDHVWTVEEIAALADQARKIPLAQDSVSFGLRATHLSRNDVVSLRVGAVMRDKKLVPPSGLPQEVRLALHVDRLAIHGSTPMLTKHGEPFGVIEVGGGTHGRHITRYSTACV
jgi:hypothetical protein